MTRELVPTETNEHGDETHPAFGMIGASRVTSTPGVVLFDSDLSHTNTVRVRIKGATRKRDLNHDWIYGKKQLIEVEMSEAQWASFVSSMNVGDGVPCTVREIGNESVPQFPLSSRLELSMAETHDSAQKAFDAIREAMDVYDALDTKAPAGVKRAALDTLRSRIATAVPNVDYAGKQLAKQTEDVVTKARADIEAFVYTKANQLGVEVNELIESGDLSLGVGEYPQG